MYSSPYIDLSTVQRLICFFFNDTATTEIYTLSLHDALPISLRDRVHARRQRVLPLLRLPEPVHVHDADARARRQPAVDVDRKSTRLNSSHANISYAVFCLKKKTLTSKTMAS